jgi:cell wall-associated NlpC family hydrolase
MNIDEFSVKAIGVPFKPHGRKWEGWDCWGLICVAYKELFNIELPSYTDDYESTKDREKIAELYLKGRELSWYEVDRPDVGDIVFLFFYGRMCHVGLAVNEEKILHVEHGINTCLERIKNFRIEGIYRYGGD